MGIWKLLLAILVTLALFIGLPIVFGTYGLMPPLNPKANYILAIAAVGLVLKLIMGDLISGKFEYHRNGYDLCIVTLGASLSSLSLQIMTDRDLFPDLQNARVFAGLASITPNPISQRIVLLLGVFLLSCVMSLLTALVGKAIREGEKWKNCLSLINFLIGAGVFGAYLLMLITKA